MPFDPTSSPFPAKRLRLYLRGRSADGRPWSWRVILLGLFGAALVALAGRWLVAGVEWRALPGLLQGIPAVWLIVAMALLPMVGVSVSVLYLVVGARFGPWWGGLVVVGATAVHLLLSYAVARGLLRRPLENFLRRRRYQLPTVPAGEESGVALLGALVPGLPYFARNYLLALSGLRLRIYFCVCLPVYVVRSYLVIFVGDVGTEPSARQLAWLAGFYLVNVVVCAAVIGRLRRRYRLTPPRSD
jgi:uncharacterized membrane protein YdjX (TVP38/TMEM64 family)